MAEKGNKPEKKKKNNIFKRLWQKLGRRGRIAVTTVAYVGMFAIPMTVPLQLGCLAIIMNESKIAQKLIAKARRRWPDKTEKMVAKTVKSKFCPGVLKDLLNKTDPKVFFANEEKEKKAKAAAQAAKGNTGKKKSFSLARILTNKNKYMAARRAEKQGKQKPATSSPALTPNNAVLNATKDGGR